MVAEQFRLKLLIVHFSGGSMITKSILKEYRYIKKEHIDLEYRIRQLQRKLDELASTGTVIDSVSGGYGGTQHFKIEGFPDGDYSKIKSKLLLQKSRHEQNISRIDEIEKEVCDFIDSIPESRARTIFRYYYEDGMSQQSIAFKMNLDQTSVSREIDRWISKLA